MDQYSFNRADFNKGVNESLGAIVVIAAFAALAYGGPHAVRGVKKGAKKTWQTVKGWFSDTEISEAKGWFADDKATSEGKKRLREEVTRLAEEK